VRCVKGRLPVLLLWFDFDFSRGLLLLMAVTNASEFR
jgi:hypothetical protein